MDKTKLIKQLEKQLLLLKQEGEYVAQPFKVWYLNENTKKYFGENIIRIEKENWEWGISGYQGHQVGDTVWILCRLVGKDNMGEPVYTTESGESFKYRYIVYYNCPGIAPDAHIFLNFTV